MHSRLFIWLIHSVFICALAYFSFHNMLSWPIIIVILIVKIEIQILTYQLFKDDSKNDTNITTS